MVCGGVPGTLELGKCVMYQVIERHSCVECGLRCENPLTSLARRWSTAFHLCQGDYRLTQRKAPIIRGHLVVGQNRQPLQRL